MMLCAESVRIALGPREVVHDVSLTLARGEVLAVVGPNGAGKSTLLKGLGGLIAPAAGRIMLEDRLLGDWRRDALGRVIAYLPQERVAHWALHVEAIVGLGRLPHAGSVSRLGEKDRLAVTSAMRMMDVSHLAQRSIAELSGGERARVLVARALAQSPRLLIADEPTAGLDPSHQLSLFQRFQQLAREGCAIIVALHDLSLAARYCDRTLLLRDGKAVALGRTAEVLTPANLAAAYEIRAHVGAYDGVPIVLPLSTLP